MDEQLTEAWLKGDAFSLELLLCNKKAKNYVGLIEHRLDDMEWKYRLFPKVARVLLEECTRQNIESWDLERLGVYCLKVGEYGTTTRHAELLSLANCTATKANHQQITNRYKCRKAVVTLLGCCGKKRRAKGGILKDIGVIIAKNVWKTRRMDLWKSTPYSFE
jgi:hypothetical protein